MDLCEIIYFNTWGKTVPGFILFIFCLKSNFFYHNMEQSYILYTRVVFKHFVVLV